MRNLFIFGKKGVMVFFTTILLMVVCLPYKVDSQSSPYFNAISITTQEGTTKDIKWENFARLVRRSPEFFTFFFKGSNDSIQNVISFRSNKIDFTNVNQSELTDLDFIVYPNPSMGSVNVNAFLKNNTDVDLEVTSLVGQKIKKYHFQNQYGEFIYQLNLSSLPNGTYICSLKTEKGIFSKKILKK